MAFKLLYTSKFGMALLQYIRSVGRGVKLHQAQDYFVSWEGLEDFGGSAKQLTESEFDMAVQWAFAETQQERWRLNDKRRCRGRKGEPEVKEIEDRRDDEDDPLTDEEEEDVLRIRRGENTPSAQDQLDRLLGAMDPKFLRFMFAVQAAGGIDRAAEYLGVLRRLSGAM